MARKASSHCRIMFSQPYTKKIHMLSFDLFQDFHKSRRTPPPLLQARSQGTFHGLMHFFLNFLTMLYNSKGIVRYSFPRYVSFQFRPFHHIHFAFRTDLLLVVSSQCITADRNTLRKHCIFLIITITFFLILEGGTSSCPPFRLFHLQPSASRFENLCGCN